MTLSGVTFLDHTADVGFDVSAPTPPALFNAAALAMLALLRGEEDGADRAGLGPRATAGEAQRTLRLETQDPPRLLADFLRELLFLHEIDALDYLDSEFDRLDLEARPCRLDARVRLLSGGHAVREIKGVTYHEIAVRPLNDRWTARVIFDV